MVYVAVRTGRHVNNCIFQSWCDAKYHVERFEPAVYKTFELLDDAAKYTQMPTKRKTQNDLDGADSDDACDSQPLSSLKKLSSTSHSGDGGHGSKPSQIQCDNEAINDSGKTTIEVSATSTCLESATTAAAKPVREVSDKDDSIERNSVIPASSGCKVANSSTSDGPTKSNKRKISSSTPTTPVSRTVIKKGESRPYPTQASNDNSQEKPEVDAHVMHKRKPSKAWLAMFERLKLYRTENGSFQVSTKDEEETALRRWISDQRHQYKCYRMGKKHFTSQQKIQMLLDIEFDFNYHPEDAQYATRSETEEQMKKWEEMFNKLKNFKEKFKNCNVPKSDVHYGDLYKWICGQRLEYKKLKDGHHCRMTAKKMQQLNDIGFSFNPRSRYQKWDERMVQLRQFKNEHGHLRVPVSNPDLGEFVARQRVEYAKYTEGDKNVCMDADRAQELLDLGFIFQAGKRRTMNQKVPRKTWDERFDELIQFKNTNGHTLVPQSNLGLGEWVHKQRKNYKKLKSGKPSPLSTERALKLADVGFVFDASGFRRGRKMRQDHPNAAPAIVMPVHVTDTYRAMI